MAYDEDLAQRLRDLIGRQKGLAEKRMMGGLCFLLGGNMVAGADRTKDGHRRFLFRVGKENEAEADALDGGAVMVQGGRPMRGFYFVDAEATDDDMLRAWVALALRFVRTLPAKA